MSLAPLDCYFFCVMAVGGNANHPIPHGFVDLGLVSPVVVHPFNLLALIKDSLAV